MHNRPDIFLQNLPWPLFFKEGNSSLLEREGRRDLVPDVYRILDWLITLRALREDNSLDLFFLALQGREEREFLEGKLDAHLKNVEPPSVDRRVNAVFHDRINVVEHDPHRGIEVPVLARGEISSLLSLLPFAEVQ
jgi:hypothetical protein